jgi:hypothetical protein
MVQVLTWSSSNGKRRAAMMLQKLLSQLLLL